TRGAPLSRVNASLLVGAVLNGMVTGMLYALMGVGLSLILGLLNIPNFAHGVLYALGAYVMISGAKAFGFLGGLLAAIVAVAMLGAAIDRKSTRLNSSHGSISYAVFCLKKKKKSQ